MRDKTGQINNLKLKFNHGTVKNKTYPTLHDFLWDFL